MIELVEQKALCSLKDLGSITDPCLLCLSLYPQLWVGGVTWMSHLAQLDANAETSIRCCLMRTSYHTWPVMEWVGSMTCTTNQMTGGDRGWTTPCSGW